jgi:hypothetical protein
MREITMLRLKFTLLGLIALLVIIGIPYAPTVAANDNSNSTHAVDNDNRNKIIKGSEATLTRTDTGISFTLETYKLGDTSAYTIWWIIDQPGQVREGNGSSTDIVMLATGGFSNNGGEGKFAATLETGPIKKRDGSHVRGRPEDRKFNDPMNAKVTLVIRSHGPAQAGLEDEQIGTFGGGCSNTNPDDGTPGNFACDDVQRVIFPAP